MLIRALRYVDRWVLRAGWVVVDEGVMIGCWAGKFWRGRRGGVRDGELVAGQIFCGEGKEGESAAWGGGGLGVGRICR